MKLFVAVLLTICVTLSTKSTNAQSDLGVVGNYIVTKSGDTLAYFYVSKIRNMKIHADAAKVWKSERDSAFVIIDILNSSIERKDEIIKFADEVLAKAESSAENYQKQFNNEKQKNNEVIAQRDYWKGLYIKSDRNKKFFKFSTIAVTIIGIVALIAK